MRFHYAGKYDLNPDSLPHDEHEPNAVRFKEPDSMKKLAVIMNLLSVVVFIPFAVLLFLRCGSNVVFRFSGMGILLGAVLSMLSLIPHEILHAICFKGDVYMYTNLKQGMLFVAGTERMSKARFIFMSLLPNIIFGFIPFIAAMIFPTLTILGVFGVVSIASGAGDYYNVYHALTQVPNSARVYMHKMNSYWYIPEKTGESCKNKH